MGVYIRGMEMPTSCNACMFDVYGLCLINKNIEGKDELTHSCPLIHVPAHGRLIVEDDAIETAWMILAGIGYRREENPQLEQTVREVYATAPTIEVE